MSWLKRDKKPELTEEEKKKLLDAQKASVAKRLRYVQLELDVIRREVEGF